MVKYIRILSLSIVSSLCVVACAATDTSAGKPVARISFDDMPPVTLGVSNITINDLTPQEKPAGDASSDFVTSPKVAIMNYFQSRFAASGLTGNLDININEVSVVSETQENQSSLLSNMGLYEQDLYDLKIVFGLETTFADGQKNRGSVLTIEKSKLLPPNLSIAERERLLAELLKETIVEADSSIVKSLDKTFGVLTSTPLGLPVQTGYPVMNSPSSTNNMQPIVDDPSYNSGYQQSGYEAEALSPPKEWGEQYKYGE